MADDKPKAVDRLREFERVMASHPHLDPAAIEAAIGHLPSEVLLEFVFESIPAMVVLKDSTGVIRRANSLATEFFGKQAEGIVGLTMSELAPEQQGQGESEDAEILTTGRQKLGIVRPYCRYDKELRWLRLDKIPHHSREGVVDGIIVFGIDVTDLVRLQPPANA